MHESLTEELREQSTRFLIVIDDIDRLAPDEALLVFRLIKSVGRLPNVVYLLAFDRELAERIVEERFPSEGSHYLEKIVQASFDLPQPEPDELRQTVLAALDTIGCVPDEKQIVRFMNLFYDVVTPYLRTPRNAIRLTSTFGVTWPAVKGEVDATDFLSIETLRLFEPHVFRAIRANPDRLCGTSENDRSRNREERAAIYDAMLLSEVPETRREHMRRALRRLFPRLESVWRNTHYGSNWLTTWRRDRLICSPQHFSTYFRFTLGGEASPKNVITRLIVNAGDPAYVRAVLRQAAGELRRSGRTRASLIFLSSPHCQPATSWW